MKKDDVFNACVERLRALPPVKKVKIATGQKRADRSKEFELEIITDRGAQLFTVEIHGELKRPLPAHLIVQNKPKDIPNLILARYVNPSIADSFKDNHVYYIDVQGNAYIHIKDILYIDVYGKKPELPNELKDPSIFNPKGMRLLFVLLAESNRLNDTIRELAARAGVSKDRVSSGIREMIRENWLYETKNGSFFFADKKKIFEKWLANYGDRFRPSLVLGSYKIMPRLLNELPKRLKEIFKDDLDAYALGGSIGANQLIPYYTGPTAQVFVKPKRLNDLIRELKLMPAREPDVTLFDRFSEAVDSGQKPHGTSVAHPLFLYAEMLYQGSPGNREWEVAEKIYQKYIQRELNET